ncbi:MAG: hypothetical protein WBM97_14690, partial [Sedimenticolaceae bacterium]
MNSGWRSLLAWRVALRDPGLRLLLAAVLVAVAALSTVAFFADRVERARCRAHSAQSSPRT